MAHGKGKRKKRNRKKKVVTQLPVAALRVRKPKARHWPGWGVTSGLVATGIGVVSPVAGFVAAVGAFGLLWWESIHPKG